MATAFAQPISTAAQTVAAGAPVVFDSTTAANDVAFASGTSDAAIVEPGTYVVMAMVVGDSPSTFAVEVNGSPVTGGVLPAIGNVSSGAVIVNVQAGDRISVVNAGSNEVTLSVKANGAANATVYIQKLA